MAVATMVSSAGGLLAMLNEDHPRLKLYALSNLNKCVDYYWPEISTSVTVIRPMEGAAASGFCSSSIFPIAHKSSESNSLRLPVISYSSPVQCNKKVFCKAQNRMIIKRSSSDRISLCKVSAERAGGEAPSFSSVDSVVKRKKLAVFVSGGGSNFRSIQEACAAGSINGDIVLLVTNKKDCGGAVYARDNGIEVLLFPKAKDEPDGLSATDLVNELRRFEVDFILLAGYLKLIPPELIQAYPRSILNIHPSLLPAFGGKGHYGMKVHRAVIASGARFSGPTIHFVNEHYDEGRILAQRIVPVLATDTPEDLAARVLREEHRLYVEAASALCEERIVWRADGVPLIQSKDNPDEHY